MNVLLVTTTNKLAEKLAVLSPELEYCAVVVEDVEPAKEILSKVGLSPDLLQPMSELQSCVEKVNYDYALLVQDTFSEKEIMRLLLKYGVPNNKLLSFQALLGNSNFNTERALRYYQEHCRDFEMFATGISEAYGVLDGSQFKHKLFNIAKPSQDLYYDYNVAKHIVLCGGGILRYDMLSSDSRRILSTIIFRKYSFTDAYCCLILLLLMICIISSYPAMSTGNFCARNGWRKDCLSLFPIQTDPTAPLL